MKIKELIRDKWGWVGAIVGASFVLFLRELICNFKTIPGMCSGAVEIPYFGMYQVMIPAGFILGIIAQKLWRKFK